MNGNHRTTGASNVPGNKRSRTNNKPNNINPQSQQRKIRKAVRPVNRRVTRSQTSVRTPK